MELDSGDLGEHNREPGRDRGRGSSGRHGRDGQGAMRRGEHHGELGGEETITRELGAAGPNLSWSSWHRRSRGKALRRAWGGLRPGTQEARRNVHGEHREMGKSGSVRVPWKGKLRGGARLEEWEAAARRSLRAQTGRAPCRGQGRTRKLRGRRRREGGKEV
ncbi:hypothetical protein ZEAMMB73_Zm00001d030602 [Zea mays]|jgi:hypothetical protein|uniref:Uncharacterized protein n=1 Tax=Zea mays TaxID=4577 RepID=A0A1D6KD44_MAIZE|nr:hypothetical protein ZEAMMB73_Zm00001d030602 [Zea mays]